MLVRVRKEVNRSVVCGCMSDRNAFMFIDRLRDRVEGKTLVSRASMTAPSPDFAWVIWSRQLAEVGGKRAERGARRCGGGGRGKTNALLHRQTKTHGSW